MEIGASRLAGLRLGVGHERVAHHEAREAREISICGPQLSDAVRETEGSYACVVHARPGGLTDQLGGDGPILASLGEQAQPRRLAPGSDLVESALERSGGA